MSKKHFYRSLFYLTIPIVLQNLITTSLNLLDTLMIGRLGEIPLAAVGIANQYYFLFTLFIFGIAGGAGVLIAQLFGKKNYTSIKKVVARSLLTGVSLATVFAFIGLACAEDIIGLFNSTPEIISTGASYLKITIVGYLFTSISFVLASALRSVNETKLPMEASFLGLCINGFLNYCLIFGAWIFPTLGVEGAAIATIVARIIECFVLLLFTYKRVPELRMGLDDFFSMSPETYKALKQVTLPILFNEACWGIGSVTYIALYANLGAQSAAAMQISSTIINLFMVVAFGLSYSALVVVGNKVGAGELEGAFRSSLHIRGISRWIGCGVALSVFGVSSIVPQFFSVSETVMLMTRNVLLVFACMLPFRIMNMVMIVGVLRGGGDAAFGSLLQGCTLWLIGIPLTYLIGYVYHMPLHYVVGISVIEELVKLLMIRYRFKSRKWLKQLVGEVSYSG